MLSEKIVYSPVLRLKTGERNALISLTAEVADRVAPRVVVPSPAEADPEKGRAPTPDEFIHQVGKQLGVYWAKRPCFVDAQFAFKAYGTAYAHIWFPKMLQIARDFGAVPIPLATLAEAATSAPEAFRQSLDKTEKVKFGLRVSFDDLLDETGFKTEVSNALLKIGVSSTETVVLLDLAGADLSDSAVVAKIVSGALQTLQELGVWAKIFLQGGNYPQKNPAAPGAATTVERKEWEAWTELLSIDPAAKDYIAFGDYGADSTKFDFGTGGIPIPHIRYCVEGKWHIVRGRDDLKVGEAMRFVAKTILLKAEFAGRAFSRADNRIHQIANGLDTCGNASTWREINTAHHITQVIFDLGKIYGFSIDEAPVGAAIDQLEMFSDPVGK